KVWILADLFESDSRFAHGATAQILSRGTEGPLAARVAESLPQFDLASRTLRLRLEVDNPGLSLRPGMSVDVEFRVQDPAVLLVPAEAVLDAGSGRSVFVDRGEGFFQRRRITTGAAYGESVQITGGLREGERIAVSGTFLLDSEARLTHEQPSESGL